MNKKKFAVYPNEKVSFLKLCRLYGVTPSLCLDMSSAKYKGSKIKKDSGLIELRPQICREDYTFKMSGPCPFDSMKKYL